jgi:hypothetical protein
MSQATTAPSRPPAPPAVPTPGPLGRLAALAFRNRGRTVAVWVVALAVLAALSAAFAGTFTADYSAPGSDSRRGSCTPSAGWRSSVSAQSRCVTKLGRSAVRLSSLDKGGLQGRHMKPIGRG